MTDDLPGPRRQPVLFARKPPTATLPPVLANLMNEARESLAAPFEGVRPKSGAETGLYRLQRTGIDVSGLRHTACALLDSLSPTERATASFPLSTDMWRAWNNTHPYFTRHGLCLELMSASQREQALSLVAASLGRHAYRTARSIMRLNGTLLEMTGSGDEYGEWLYWLSIMGDPRADMAWGFQLDGHHLNLNSVVIGDQLVGTPTFLGAEPVVAWTGSHRGTTALLAEESLGYQLARSLSPEQFSQARIASELPGDVFTSCYRDNFQIEYEGTRFDDLDQGQQDKIVSLMELYINRLPPCHAAMRSREVRAHLGRTRFAWIGNRDENSPFYYRIYNPVILIEFDHLPGVALDNDEPTRDHIHTIVRSPNGNDYGRDLLRQHYEQSHAASPGR